MTEVVIKEVAKNFLRTEQEIVTDGVRAFLNDRLRVFEAERQYLLAKYAVSSMEELDAHVAKHPEREADLLPDLQRADYLVAQISDLAHWVETLNNGD